jgi:hypothetical protein
MFLFAWYHALPSHVFVYSHCLHTVYVQFFPPPICLIAQPPQRSKLKKEVIHAYCSSTSLIILCSANPASDECSNSDSENGVVDVPVPAAPRKQTVRKSGEPYPVGSAVYSTHQLQGPDPIVDDDAVSDNNCFENIEESSKTETDDSDEVVVVETDDPFFEDPKNNGNKLSKKLAAEVRPPLSPLLTYNHLSH